MSSNLRLRLIEPVKAVKKPEEEVEEKFDDDHNFNSVQRLDFYYEVPNPRYYYLKNPTLDLSRTKDNNNISYYSCSLKKYEELLCEGVLLYDPEDTYPASTALGFTFGFWQTAHLLLGNNENNLSFFDNTAGWNADLMRHFQPISLAFPLINAIVGGLLHYTFEVSTYKNRFDIEPSPETKKAIWRQSARLAFSMAAGTLGFEAGLQAAKAVLTLTHVLPHSLLVNFILAISAGFGMALLAVAAKAATEKNSARHLLKFFVATFLQGSVWWMFSLVPYELPTAVGKAVLNSFCTMLSVMLLNECTKPIEDGFNRHGFFGKKDEEKFYEQEEDKSERDEYMRDPLSSF